MYTHLKIQTTAVDFNQDCASRINPRSADRRQKADATTVNIKQASSVVFSVTNKQQKLFKKINLN